MEKELAVKMFALKRGETGVTTEWLPKDRVVSGCKPVSRYSNLFAVVRHTVVKNGRIERMSCDPLLKGHNSEQVAAILSHNKQK